MPARPGPAHRVEPDHGVDADDLIEFVAAEAASAEADAEAEAGHPRIHWFRRFRGLVAQLVRFGIVGGVGVVVDFGIYNALMLTVFSGDQPDAVPFAVKAASTLVAIGTNWIGNRLWAFRDHRRHDSTREGLEFLGVSLAGLVVGLIPLWVLRSGLGVESLAADNAANVVGLVLGAVFRFAFYRFWVFAPWRRGARTRTGADAGSIRSAASAPRSATGSAHRARPID